jgi:uncharacterized phage protein gp47/JayE
MPAYFKKSKNEILQQELAKIARNTPFTATGAGSIVRALADVFATQLGDMYDALDYNVNQTLVTTATGAALDLIGTVYNVQRKKINEVAALDKKLGAFIFYISTPYSQSILIPRGTNIYSSTSSYIGQRFSYKTTEDTVIPAGRTRAYASIEPNFSDNVYTAGKNTLIIHDASAPAGVTIHCTNTKEIAPLNESENDEQYRIRIIRQIRVATSGSGEALRFAGLAVNGVRDVKIRQTPYGLGSFEAIIVPERDSNTVDTLSKARAAMEEVRPVGVRMFSVAPTPLTFDMELTIVAPTSAIESVNVNIANRVNVAISRYLNSLLPGSDLIYNQLLVVINDASDLIKDVIVKRMSINGREIMRRNFKPGENEQIVLGRIGVGVAASA